MINNLQLNDYFCHYYYDLNGLEETQQSFLYSKYCNEKETLNRFVKTFTDNDSFNDNMLSLNEIISKSGIEYNQGVPIEALKISILFCRINLLIKQVLLQANIISDMNSPLVMNVVFPVDITKDQIKFIIQAFNSSGIIINSYHIRHQYIPQILKQNIEIIAQQNTNKKIIILEIDSNSQLMYSQITGDQYSISKKYVCNYGVKQIYERIINNNKEILRNKDIKDLIVNLKQWFDRESDEEHEFITLKVADVLDDYFIDNNNKRTFSIYDLLLPLIQSVLSTLRNVYNDNNIEVRDVDYFFLVGELFNKEQITRYFIKEIQIPISKTLYIKKKTFFMDPFLDNKIDTNEQYNVYNNKYKNLDLLGLLPIESKDTDKNELKKDVPITLCDVKDTLFIIDYTGSVKNIIVAEERSETNSKKIVEIKLNENTFCYILHWKSFEIKEKYEITLKNQLEDNDLKIDICMINDNQTIKKILEVTNKEELFNFKENKYNITVYSHNNDRKIRLNEIKLEKKKKKEIQFYQLGSRIDYNKNENVLDVDLNDVQYVLTGSQNGNEEKIHNEKAINKYFLIEEGKIILRSIQEVGISALNYYALVITLNNNSQINILNEDGELCYSFLGNMKDKSPNIEIKVMIKVYQKDNISRIQFCEYESKPFEELLFQNFYLDNSSCKIEKNKSFVVLDGKYTLKYSRNIHVKISTPHRVIVHKYAGEPNDFKNIFSNSFSNFFLKEFNSLNESFVIDIDKIDIKLVYVYIFTSLGSNGFSIILTDNDETYEFIHNSKMDIFFKLYYHQKNWKFNIGQL